VLAAVTARHDRLPADVESRLAQFTELVATAISNVEARKELQRLADEQAALRRAATVVAKEAKPEDVFSAVVREIRDVLDAQLVTICRSESEGFVVVDSDGIRGFAAGTRWPLNVPSLAGVIHRARRPVRIDDFTNSGGLDAIARGAGITSAVGAPIVVGGHVWGSICAGTTRDKPLPPGTEELLVRFTDLAATSVSNAIMRDELAASRARVIAAADEARRRIERDLHDGAQQRLVTLSVALRTMQATMPAGSAQQRAEVARVADGMAAAIEELRELSRGIHPAVLTEGGLAPALKALRRRSAVRVTLAITCECRLPDQVEAAAYYTVSEALTNASRHAGGARVWVSVEVTDGTLHLSIRDDGVGGADPGRGSGLTGLKDRIEALAGRIQIDSAPGSGTRITVEIPIGQPVQSLTESSERPTLGH
jgi:signal transduction histidine kinase